MAKDFKKGEQVFIRTVTFYFTGKVAKATRNFVTLKKASCIFNTGALNRFLCKGVRRRSEVERLPGKVRISIGSIVDVSRWRHGLPARNR